MASTWNRVTPTTSAPSLAEIQRIEERKQAELHEHMKAIHHEQLIQQQQQQQQQRARWNQQQGFVFKLFQCEMGICIKTLILVKT